MTAKTVFLLVLLWGAAMLVSVSGERLPGRVTSLATFNAALFPLYSEMETRANMLIDLVSLSIVQLLL